MLLPEGADQGEIRFTADDLEVAAALAAMTDAEVRAALAARLRAERVAEESGGLEEAFSFLGGQLQEIGRQLQFLWLGTGMLEQDLVRAWHRLRGDMGHAAFVGTILFTLGCLLAGYLAQMLLARSTAGVKRRLEQPPGGTTSERFVKALMRGGLDVGRMVAFALTALLLYFLLFDDEGPFRQLFVTYFTAVVIVWAVAMAIRLVMAPFAPAIRVIPASDPVALFLYRWILRLVLVGSLGWLTARLFVDLGADFEVYFLIIVGLGVLLTLMAIAAVWSARRPVAAALRQRQGSATARMAGVWSLVAGSWHFLATLYLIRIFLVWLVNYLTGGAGGFGAVLASFALIALLPLANGLCRILADRVFPRDLPPPPSPIEGAEGHARPIPGAQLQRSYREVGNRLFSLIAIAILAAILLSFWNVSLPALFGDERAHPFLSPTLDFLFTLAVGYFAWSFAAVALARRMPMSVPPEGHGEDPDARARTLVPLFRNALLVLLIVLTAMLGLASLGLDIGPLIASAGVVGIALGFGAQSLVRDIVAGVFFLIDDAFRVGEYVEIGELRGQVESISLRSLRLRHHRGAIHTLPFGEMKSITNYSRDWVIYKMEFRLPGETDLAKVKKIIKTIGADMMKDADLGPKMIEPLKSQGVFAMEDSDLIIRVKFMAKPGEQFVLRREAYQRIQQAFKDNGITFAHKKVEVRVPDEGLSGRDLQAAAAEAVRQDMQPAAAGGGDDR